MSEQKPYKRVQKQFTTAGQTKQEFKDECSITAMIQKYQQKNIMPAVNPNIPQYGDFSEVPTLHEAVNQIAKARSAFMELPSLTRRRFGNNPSDLVEFLRDPKNAQEAFELGLANEPTAPDPEPAPEDPTPPEPAPEP